MEILKTKSGSFNQLKYIVETYGRFLPISTYPWVMLSIASCVVFFAWFGGNYLFHDTPLIQRMIYSWLITSIEYTFLLPGISASVEVLGYSQNSIAVILHALQLIAYFILNSVTTKYTFTWRHAVAFPMMIIAIILVAYDPKKPIINIV